MKRNLTFAVVGLTLGLVSGFKASNYSYRSEQTAKRMAGINAAGTSAAAGAAGANGASAAGTQAQVQAVIERARQEPPNFEALHEAAHMFVQVQRPDGALEFLLKAQQVKPDDAETMAEIAEAYYLTQKFDEAIKWGSPCAGNSARTADRQLLPHGFLRRNQHESGRGGEDSG
jgi:tetratricopeptide (TPR) repeat protein